MRVLRILLALVAAPFVAGVAQGLGHDAAHCARRADQHPGKDINKCPDQTPPPPPPSSGCVVVAPPVTGTGQLTGTVFNSSNWSFIGNACVELSLNGQFLGRAMSDVNGVYSFSGLGTNSYDVCLVVPSTMTETFPSSGPGCPTGGYTLVSVTDGMISAFWDFAMQ
jgi:hypothetical protein